ncbi:MAG: alpha/beta hydrolase [Gemmatimonadaceae bacterium]
MIEHTKVAGVSVLAVTPRERTRPPVLFVHGYFVDASVWTMWLEFFAARGIPAFAVNLRGRAGSPTSDLGRASIDDFVEDASAVARHIGAPAVVGHSMGGLIAQKLAERDEVSAGVLLTPAPPRGIKVLSPRVAMLQLKYMPAILLSRVVRPAPEDLRELVLNRIPANQQETLLAAMIPDSGRAGRDMSITGFPVDATRVRCPLLVIAAEHDHFIRPRVVERVARRYGAPFEVARGHGHMLIAEPGWDALADRVERWIGEHS